MLSRFINGMVLSGLVFLLLININTGFSQEWSKDQKMVWNNVETYWKISSEENLEGYMAYFHEDYLGWAMNTPVPSTKSDVSKWMKHWWSKSTVSIYDIQPVGIAVFGDVAVVHYYYTMMVANEEGKEKSRSGSWTDVLKKQGDKWVLIGDRGGQDDNN